jgi:hypothetical protein
VAPFSADNRVSDALERTNQTVGGHAARDFHAASTEINSSFT